MSVSKKTEKTLPNKAILEKIYFIRNKKVMLDRDLVKLYGDESKVMKQQVRRNINRFPEDFMFDLTKEELMYWRSQFVTSNSDMIMLIFEYLKQLEQTRQEELKYKNRKK